jgi:uncharacterized protein (TIGR02996 family)
MTATLRYDIGQQGAHEIEAIDPSLLNELGARDASRYAGFRRARFHCKTFAVKLPAQAGNAYRLQDVCRRVMGREKHGVIYTTCQALREKLVLSLGLPYLWVIKRGEAPFLHALDLNPNEPATWHAYADYLQEQTHEHDQLRGKVIAEWLGPKAVKVKYGVTVTACELRKYL